MGEVYRARDTKLRRDVAIKVLPPSVARDPDRLRRFEREAHSLASLNHPHIAAIYGFEELAGITALVLELVEGLTLAERIAAGPVPVADALVIARQIADALDASHERGIVHRDLKPANVKLTPDGSVKILDFGLAKMEPTAREVAESPTITAFATREGVIAGTAPYMSPEQARGKTVDKRADIWAFGCVLYEVLTGRRAFAGDTTTDVLAAVVHRDPDWKLLPRTTPDNIRRLLIRCLEKDPTRRLRDIGEARVEIADALAPSPAARGWSRDAVVRLAGVAGVVSLVAIAGVWLWTERQPRGMSGAPLVKRLTSDVGLTTAPALSPDGTLVAYASDRAGEGNLDIWVQQVAGGDPIRLTRHAADDTMPDFSPDGTQIAFRSERDGGGIYLASALGGEATLLAPDGFNPRFSPDGQWIAYHTGMAGVNNAGIFHFGGGQLLIVRATGGPPQRIQPTAKAVDRPIWSPDSQHLLMLASFETGIEPADWWITPLKGSAAQVDRAPLREQRLRSAYPTAWLTGNRIVFSAYSGDSRNSWMLALSPQTWQIEGHLQRLTSGTSVEGATSLAVTARGLTLTFSNITQNIDLWSVPLARDGTQAAGPAIPVTQDAFEDVHPALTADGRTLVYSSGRRDWELYARDLITKRETKLISMSPDAVYKPVLTADGSKFAFWRQENQGRPSAAFVAELRRAPDGTLRAGTPRQLPAAAPEGAGWPWSWSPDGTMLWYDPDRWPRVSPNHLYDPTGARRTIEFGHPQHGLAFLAVSPDGRWVLFSEPMADSMSRIVAAPVKDGKPGGEREWVVIAPPDPGVNWPAWAPSGDVIYFTSARDGFVCVWAQRVSRDTMRPLGPAVAIHHAHAARLSISGVGPNRRGMAAARDKVIFNMAETSGNIWMAEVEAGR
jgi:Tol biopolymer transport system component